MTQFHFRLNTLLRLREAECQRRQLELAQALEAERLLQQQIDDVAAELVRAREQGRRAAAPGAVQVDQLLELERYALTMQAQFGALHDRKTQVSDEIERRRAVLVEANRQVKMLEKLRDKQAEEFRVEQLQMEQKITDEIGARR
jgi:flagellar FliJ protein